MTVHIPPTVFFWLAVVLLVYAVLLGGSLGLARWPVAGGAALVAGSFLGGGWLWAGGCCAGLGVLAAVDALRRSE